MDSDLPFELGGGFDGLYGLAVTEMTSDRARGHVEVRDELKQPAGLVHGGGYPSIAESLASRAPAAIVLPQGKPAVGLSTQTSFLRPITQGRIHADAKARHRGRTTWIWEVEISDDDGRLCVLTRTTIAV